MRRNIVYKVALVKDGKWMSTNAAYLNTRYMIPKSVLLEYGIGKTTVPNVGKLFVFGTPRDAARFTYSSDTHKIIKGYAKNPKIAKKRLSLDSFQGDNLNIFWRDHYINYTFPPDGTFFCDSFTGLKVINNEI